MTRAAPRSRPVTQGSFADRDMHSGQQHVLLAAIEVPEVDAARARMPKPTRSA